MLEHEGIKFWCYNAGHVLGAAMFMIEIAVCMRKKNDTSSSVAREDGREISWPPVRFQLTKSKAWKSSALFFYYVVVYIANVGWLPLRLL